MKTIAARTPVRASSRATDDRSISKRAIALLATVALGAGLLGGAGIARLQAPKNPATLKVKPVVTAPTGASSSVNAGPSHFEGMVPRGYQHSEAGAIAAAASYTAMTTELMFRPEYEARAAVRSIATADAAAAVESSVMDPIGGVRQGLAVAGTQNPDGRALIRTTPLGTRTISYSQDAARIDVWALSLVAVEAVSNTTGSAEPLSRAIYTTTSYGLVWTDGDWHVADLKAIGDSGPGLLRATPTPVTPLIDSATRFEPFRYQPSAGSR